MGEEALVQSDLEAERLLIWTENFFKLDLGDPWDAQKCRGWRRLLAKSCCEEFFREGPGGSVPPTLKQVSQIMQGAFALVMQGRGIPSTESGRSKPSKCAACVESLFGHDEQGVHVVPREEHKDVEPWMRTWAPPVLCPMCEHLVHSRDSEGPKCMENNLMDHFYQSLAQGILIRARWPHMYVPERCRNAAEVRTERACPDICPNESVGEN